MNRYFFFVVLFPFFLFSSSKKTKNYRLNDTKIVNPVIIVDPGHGGKDKGACVYKPYCKEKTLALETALLLEKHLKQLGYKVIMTRKNDQFISLNKRVAIANHAGDLFISIHYNSCPSSSPHGIEVHYTNDKKNKKRSLSSQKLAKSILHRLIIRTKAKDRGLKRGKLYVTRNTEMPAVLVEGGFITNLAERKKINQNNYRDRIAKSIAEGIDRFLKT